MLRRSVLLGMGLTAASGLRARATSMTAITIATGVDPAFSQFYVAKEAGLFAKNGLDVTINTGPSGSAMVPFLIGNQVQAAYGSDLAGVINHNVDKNIVAVADGTVLLHWESVVARNIDSLAGLKGKKIGIAMGTGSEIFWAGIVKKYQLNAADYKLVNIEAPEMVAALERGDIDAFAVWEPWPTRALLGIKGTKALLDNSGIYQNRNFIYMNRAWIEKNRETAVSFMRALMEANDLIDKDRPGAAKMVSKFLNMPLQLATELMPKVGYDMYWNEGSLDTIKDSVALLTAQGKMKAPLDWNSYVYTDLVKAVRPENVKIGKLPA